MSQSKPCILLASLHSIEDSEKSQRCAKRIGGTHMQGLKLLINTDQIDLIITDAGGKEAGG